MAGGVLLCLDRQLRVRGMAEAHQAEAARVGRGFLDGRRGGLVAASIQRRSHAAIFRHGDAASAQVLARLVEARVSVAALEEVGGIERAAAAEVPFAAAGAEGLQRHGCARGSQLIYAGVWSQCGTWHSGRRGPATWSGRGTPRAVRLRGALLGSVGVGAVGYDEGLGRVRLGAAEARWMQTRGGTRCHAGLVVRVNGSVVFDRGKTPATVSSCRRCRR